MTARPPDSPEEGEQKPETWTSWLWPRLRQVQAFHLAFRMVGILFILVLTLLAYASLVGVPGFITRSVLHQVRLAGFEADIERVRYDMLEGLVADGVRFFTDASRTDAILEASTVALRFDPEAWINGEAGLVGMRVHNGLLRLEEPRPDIDEDEKDPGLNIHSVEVDLGIEPGGLRVRTLTGLALGVGVEGRGFVVRSSRPQQQTLGMGTIRSPLQHIREAAPEWFPKLLEQLRQVRFARKPKATVHFLVHPDRPELNEVVCTAESGPVRIRGLRFDSLEISGAFQEGGVYLRRAEATRGDDFLVVKEVEIDLAERTVSATASSTLPAPYWTSMVPISWREKIREQGISVAGAMAGELILPTTPVEQLGQVARGWVSVEQASIRDVWLETARLDFEIEPDLVRISDAQAEVGREEHRGPLTMKCDYMPSTRSYHGHWTSQFDPAALMPIFTHEQQKVIRRFKYDDSGPRVDVEYAGTLGEPDAFSYFGSLNGTNLYCHGGFMQSFSANLSFTNRVMVMEPFHLLREEGELLGRTVQDLDAKTTRLHLESTADPKVLAMMLGPNPARAMRFFRVEGPARFEADGLVDYGTGEQTELHVTASATNFGINWFLAEEVALDLHFLKNSVYASNIVGTLYGGPFEADVAFHGLGLGTNLSYEVSAACTNVDFGELVVQMKQDREAHKGTFSAGVDVAGLTGLGHGHTALGEGHVVIEEGALFRIPLLGGLSRLLGKISPGLGHVSQTDFQSTFKIQNGKVVTDDIVLHGDTLSLHAEGQYGFNGDLDFSVDIEPLNEGVIAELVQLLTSPLTMLLDFKLGGTVVDPTWRPQNLPKELFLITE